MAILEQIIAHLDPYERNEFLAYVERHPRNAREQEIVRLLLQNNPPDPAELKELLYPSEGKGPNHKRDAYNGLRKQALNKLFQWIMIYRMDSDHSPDGRIYSLITVGRLMLERNAVDSCAFLLQQAEKLATLSRQYEVLESIYSYLIAHSVEMDLNVKEVISNWESNRKRYDRICFLQRVYALKRQSVRNAMKLGKALNPEISIKSIFKEVVVSHDDANDPAFMHMLCRIVRTGLSSGKDYTAFERFVTKIYTRFKSKGMLTLHDKEFELGFLYMCAHAAYRNRKFALAEQYCEMIGNMLGERGARQHLIFPKYAAVRAGVAALTGRNAEAIKLMESALEHRVDTTEISEWLNNQLNLAVYYFQADNFRKSNRTLQQIEGEHDYLVNEMGLEWCFKKNMIELIVQCELGNEDIALKSCDRIKLLYGEMLGQSMYKRVGIFLEFIRHMIKDPNIVTTPEFLADVKNAQLAWPGYKEDVQAITFFCWLRSKMAQKSYYEVLLERLKEGVL
ncbi:MAG: hypothetical protein IPP69_12075 [Flavobacteriales bacterium]|nr:hypothetical protein [Flavobacteriales bacterium]